MRSPFRLVVRTGPKAGTVYPLEDSEIFIGRDTGNDIVIEDPEVSRRHSRLFLQGNHYAIEDLGSTNGTSVNGQRLTGPYMLRPGDLVTLGEHTNLAFEGIQADQAATIAAAPARDLPSQTPPPRPAPTVPPPQAQPQPQPAQRAQPAPLPGDYAPPRSYNPPPPTYEPYPAEPVAPPPGRRLSPLVIGLLIFLGCFLLACLVFAVIDTLNLYCTLFPGIVNQFVPGYCP